MKNSRFTLNALAYGLIYQSPQLAGLDPYSPQSYAPFEQGHQNTTSRIPAYLQARDVQVLRRAGRMQIVTEV
jgi:hypothetical protein